MKYPIIDNRVVIEFEDVSDALTIRPASKANKTLVSKKHTDWDDAGASWFGVSSLRELERVVRDGWTDGVKRIYDAVGTIGNTVTPMSIKRRTVRSDQGDEYDVHRAMGGGLDTAWSSRKRQARPVAGAEITIATQIGLLSNDSTDEVFWRGAACVRLADILTEAGYRVRIVGYNAGDFCFTGPDGKNLGKLFICEIKKAGQQLDLASLAATVALAGTYRHYFLFNQLSSGFKSASNYGVTNANYVLPESDVCIRKADVKTESDAVAFINATLERFNEKARAAA